MTMLRDHLIEGLNFSRMCMNEVLKGFPEDKATFRTSDADCHALWIVGHIALSEEWVLKMLDVDGSPLPDDFGALFGYQTEVKSEGYPKFATTRELCHQSRERLMTWLTQRTDEDLVGSFDDGGANFAKTSAEAMSKTMWHEGWHTGQLSTLRRVLGLPPAF